ncbi:phosphatidylserine decarboxylase family protein [Desulfogranum mediterraneum]|uniref:phosphatidylserine decarboxylase family protein n=1 Tax=Desulfogranum mediterraneum TaxID=160661 RepID=UPI00041F7CE9|nr:phosphatidylserine decarboxylase family protein [Desulfogranum mediterraneum]
MKQTSISITPEGYPFILISAFAALIFALVDLCIPALISLSLTIFSTWFFRDPARVPPEESGAIVSPADGKVIIVKETEDERFFQGPTKKISIFMNIFDVHVNRAPLAGTVTGVRFKPGSFYAADKDKAVLHNEYCAVTMETPRKQSYCTVQIAGLIARRIVCRVAPGDRLEAGQRYGLIRFGSRVDIYLPLEADIRVRVGERVRAGESLLGIL